MKPAKKIFGNIQRNKMSVLLALGICPALAVTASLMTAIAMGAATIFVVSFSNFTISCFRKRISYSIKLPAFFIITATFTTIADLVLQAFFPELSKALGIYVPLIVVNGMILQRAEHFALKNKCIPSFIDGLYVGILFTLAIMIAGTIREILGNGSILEFKIMSENTRTILFFILPPGAFITLGFLIAVLQKPFIKNR
jgi:Na+-translocating ferredoxin:NAD+ oxidoreductase subunit E